MDARNYKKLKAEFDNTIKNLPANQRGVILAFMEAERLKIADETAIKSRNRNYLLERSLESEEMGRSMDSDRGPC